MSLNIKVLSSGDPGLDPAISNSIATIQTDFGTSPSATMPAAAVTFTSGSSALTITGDFATQKVTFGFDPSGLPLPSLAQGGIFIGGVSNIAVGSSMWGEATIGVTGNVTLGNSAVISKLLAGYTVVNGTIGVTTSIGDAFNYLSYFDSLKMPIAGGTFSGLVTGTTFVGAFDGAVASAVFAQGATSSVYAQGATSAVYASGATSAVYASGATSAVYASGATASVTFTGQAGSTQIILAALPGSTYSTAQDMQTFFHSTGWVNGGSITDNGDGTVDVDAGQGAIRNAANALGLLFFFDWAAVTNLSMVDGDLNYIYVNYNSGSPQVETSTTEAPNPFTYTDLATVYRIGTELYINETVKHTVGDHAGLMIQYNEETMPNAPEMDSAAELTELASRKFEISAGIYWNGLTRFTTPAIDTSGVDTFTSVYYNGAAWVYVPGETQISNSQYNDVSTGLANLAVGEYGVYWVYLVVNTPAKPFMIYGQEAYASLGEARTAQPFMTADLPEILHHETAILVARVIVKQGASGFQEIGCACESVFPTPALSLTSLSDVDASTPTLGDRLAWNGTKWVNQASTVSAGAGVNFYNATPTITATSTNNALAINTLSRTPVTTAEQTTSTSLATNTVAAAAWLYDTALGKASIDAGSWIFTSYAGVNSTGGGRVTTITRNIYQVIPATGTVTTTGTGTSRTATVTGATPFVAGDASATNTVASYLQTPQGIYQITAFTSSSVVTISTLSTYVNETGVTYNKWFKLFGATSSAITSISPNYAANTFTTTQGAFAIATTDKLGAITFGTSNNNTTLTTTYDGTTRNTQFQTPLVVLHGDLAGLQGGTGSGVTAQYYHLTSDEYTGTGIGTGNVARLNSPVFTTPNIGLATGSITGYAIGATSSVFANGATSSVYSQGSTYSVFSNGATSAVFANGATSAVYATSNLIAAANQYGVLLSGSGVTAVVLAPDASTTKILTSGGAAANPSWVERSTYLNYTTNTGIGLTAAVTNVEWTTAEQDATSSWNGTIFKAPSTGNWIFMGIARCTTTWGDRLVMYKEGAAYKTCSTYGNEFAQINGSAYLTAGQTLSIRPNSNQTLSSSNSGVNHWLTIFKA